MSVTAKHKYARTTLNPGQLTLLKLIYKYRFVTRQLLADSLNVKPQNGLYEKLKILIKYEYIAERYTLSYKLAGRGAEYYLLPNGLRTLQDLESPEEVPDTIIKASYKDRTISDQFIQRCLAIHKVANQLSSQYDNLRFFTKRELATFDYFPKPSPDGFISIKSEQHTKRFFVELVTENAPTFAFDKRTNQYLEYIDNDEWGVTDSPFPPVLIICESSTVERRVRRQATRIFARTSEHFEVYTSTLKSLGNVNKGSWAIWSSTNEPDELFTLDAIS